MRCVPALAVAVEYTCRARAQACGHSCWMEPVMVNCLVQQAHILPKHTLVYTRVSSAGTEHLCDGYGKVRVVGWLAALSNQAHPLPPGRLVGPKLTGSGLWLLLTLVIPCHGPAFGGLQCTGGPFPRWFRRPPADQGSLPAIAPPSIGRATQPRCMVKPLHGRALPSHALRIAQWQLCSIALHEGVLCCYGYVPIR